MATITPEMVKELRARTGIGIGACKAALSEAGGDVEKAIADLRKKGMASAVKKAGRETKEGIIVAAQAGDTHAIVEVNAETDFVVKNEKFQEMAKKVATVAAEKGANSVEELGPEMEELRVETVQSLGENIQFGRVQSFKKAANSSVGVYDHMGGKIVVIVELEGADGEEALARDIAMHAAAEAPEFLAPEDVPADTRAKEEEIARTQVQNKPANIIDKIVDGKLRAFFDQVCLIQQKFVKNPDISVGKLVEQRAKEINKPLVLKHFIRWQVGQK